MSRSIKFNIEEANSLIRVDGDNGNETNKFSISYVGRNGFSSKKEIASPNNSFSTVVKAFIPTQTQFIRFNIILILNYLHY